MTNKETIFENCSKELQRYFDSTLIITLFSDLFKKHSNLGEIKFIEHELKKIENPLKDEIIKLSKRDIYEKFKDKIKELKKIEVDLLIRNGKFDVIEFKTTISNDPREI